MKLTTINLIIESINDEYGGTLAGEQIANDAVIYLKTALICEHEGIDKAMEYFKGPHTADEWQEFRTSVVSPDKLKEVK